MILRFSGHILILCSFRELQNNLQYIIYYVSKHDLTTNILVIIYNQYK